MTLLLTYYMQEMVFSRLDRTVLNTERNNYINIFSYSIIVMSIYCVIYLLSINVRMQPMPSSIYNKLCSYIDIRMLVSILITGIISFIINFEYTFIVDMVYFVTLRILIFFIFPSFKKFYQDIIAAPIILIYTMVKQLIVLLINSLITLKKNIDKM